jgi:2-C-methyl-D-erythritol 2,4-cyclodiphosphate synthase
VRVGIGYDIHKMEQGRRLILGGIEIPYEKGLLGHSDADVLVHAICDAMLGAAGLGDIGRHFPDTSPAYKDISSMYLLKWSWEKVAASFKAISNIDATIFAQQPRLSGYSDQMAGNIADCLGMDPCLVNIKATTTEKLGVIGRGSAMAAMCVLLLE